MNEREAYIALNLVDKLGPVRVRALIAALGSPQAVFAASEDALCRAEGVGRELARAIVAQRPDVDPAAEERAARALGAAIVTPLDADYPEALKTIYDPPLALYVRGKLRPADRQAVALVGSRRCTFYGRSVADRLAGQLARAGLTVVSGLARGIDMAAHEGALKAGGRTLAVLGSALDRLYPPEGAELAERIAAQGAVISEYTLGREADRTTFPYRNRIVSGLAKGVLVVEADTKSGAMITARVAAEQGRNVYAVPGRIDSPASRGCHKLIQEGAKLAADARDVLEDFELLPGWDAAAGAAEPGPLSRFQFSAEEQAVVGALVGGPMDADTLARQSGVGVAALNGLLLNLELKHVVKMLPGRQVELMVRLAPDPTPNTQQLTTNN